MSCCSSCTCGPTCRCNYTRFLLVESLLDTAAVPGGTKVPSNATGCASMVLTHKNEFYVYVTVRHLHNITMSHLHLYNTQDPKKNGPILLFLSKSMQKPIPVLNGILISHVFSMQDMEAPYRDMTIEAFQTLLRQNKVYFNVHTVQNPDGELAGPATIVHQLSA